MIQFKDIDFLNLLFNIVTLVGIAELYNKLNGILRLVKRASKTSDSSVYAPSQYSYQEIDSGIYKIVPRPPAYMYLENLPAVDWITVDNSALTIKTNELMCSEICLILNSAIPIESHLSGLTD